jgi:hypothetical protein
LPFGLNIQSITAYFTTNCGFYIMLFKGDQNYSNLDIVNPSYTTIYYSKVNTSSLGLITFNFNQKIASDSYTYIGWQGSSSCLGQSTTGSQILTYFPNHQSVPWYASTVPYNNSDNPKNFTGTFALQINADTNCTACPAGKVAGAGAGVCTSCSAGTYAITGSSACSICPINNYCSAGAGTPTACPAGSYCPVGAGSPTPCTAGSFCPAGAGAATACPAGS